MNSIFIGIEYTDKTYEAVKVSVGHKDDKTFATNDPEKDFRSAVYHAVEIAKGRPIMMLSSTQHFVFDVPGWRYDENDMLVRDPNDYDAEGKLIDDPNRYAD